jgi:hypothetical protein
MKSNVKGKPKKKVKRKPRAITKRISKKSPAWDLDMIGKRIKDLRIKKGYSNYEYFAYEHDLPRAQYGRYENGEDMRLSSLLKVVKAFDMSLKEFFSRGIA